MRNVKYPKEDKRKYIRLDTVFPVQLRMESLDGSHFLSGWLQGFTNNVSRGGICLCINNFDPSLVEIIKKRQARVSLEIELPIFKKPINWLNGFKEKKEHIWALKDINFSILNRYAINSWKEFK